MAARPSKSVPLSLRLTAEERSALEARAGALPVSTYIKRQLFGDERRATTQFRRVAPDQALLARLLARLGGSDLATSLSALAEATSDDSLIVDEPVRARLLAACEEVRDMHRLLMQGLGKIMPEPEREPFRSGGRLPEAKNLLAEQFRKSAAGRIA